MKRIFLDTNILIDLIADRVPFSKFATEIFRKREQNQIQLFTSSHSIATTHYVLKKYIDDQKLREILYDLTDYVEVVQVDIDIIKKSLKSKHKDFEDAVQIFCAYSVGKADCIVTRNKKHFKDCEIPVLSPDEFLLEV